MKIRRTTGFDLVRVARFYALQALERIAAPGAIAVEPIATAPAMLFLVPPGSSSEWNVPRTTVLVEGSLVLPSEERRSPPGAYWLIPPSHGRLHTDVHHLRCALEAVLSPPTRRPPIPELIASLLPGAPLRIPTPPRRPRTRSRGMANARSRESVDMPESTARPTTPEADSRPLDPLDFATMVVTARSVDNLDDGVPDEDLETVTLRLRGHLALLIPELEHRLGRLGETDRARAEAGIGEARRRLDAGPGPLGPGRHAQILGRSVIALCAHLGHGQEIDDA
ncbi:DUF6415 family natural product biosynthesis protein [Streptomyces sp. NPDC056244]|uniref:DUF6415 family natural product biosynthesis protein n=2 Tax=unclassified Streptomyces TaxID=2593676 RepID=UPI0035DF7F5F